MATQRFKYRLESFESLNSEGSASNLRPGEATELGNLEPRRGKLVLTDDGEVVLSSSGFGVPTWLNVFSDSADNFYILITKKAASNDTDLYSSLLTGSTWGALSSITGNPLFNNDSAYPTPCFYKSGGDLRIGGSLSNYHKLVKYWVQTDRLNDPSPTTGEDTRRSAGLYMDNGELDSPNFNSEIAVSGSTDATSNNFVTGDQVLYAYSYFYDNAQESLLWEDGGLFTPDASNRPEITIDITAANMMWRVTHIIVYRSLNGGDWYKLTKIHINDGEEFSTNNWTWDSPSAGKARIVIYDDGNDIVDSFTSLTGYLDTTAKKGGAQFMYENNLQAYFSASTICQGRTVIGNVMKAVGESATPNTLFNDRLHFSRVGRFDSFYKEDWVDIETGDGDAIIVLESYGSQVLIFKSSSLYIWDMGTRDALNWQLVGSFRGYGVAVQTDVFRTPYGIAFKNDNGVYLYSGGAAPIELGRQNVRAALQAITIPRIVGYAPVRNQLFVGRVEDTLYLIDMDDGFATTKDISDLATSIVNTFHADNYKDQLFVLVLDDDGAPTNATVVSLNTGTTTLIPTYYSGELDFGIDTRKRVRKVRVRYKSAGNTCSFYMRTDFGTNRDIGTLTASANWKTLEFYPTVDSYGRNFRFGLVGDGALTAFELDSVEITGKVFDR